MNVDKHRKALIEAGLMAALASLFVVGTIYIPFLSILIGLLPVPFIILSIRHGAKYTILSLIIVSLLIGILTGVFYTGFVFVIFAPMALTMGQAIKKRKEPYEIIGLGAAASAISVFVLLQIIAIATGTNIIDEIANMVRSVINHQIETLTNMNINAVDANEALNYIMMIFPGLIVIQSMIGAFANYYLSSTIINRFKLTDFHLGEFSNFKLPTNIILGSFIIFILSFATKYIGGIDHTSLIANTTIIFISIFFLQGITFISYLLKKMKTPKFIRRFIIAFLVVISPLMTLVALVGLMDSLLNVRKIEK